MERRQLMNTVPGLREMDFVILEYMFRHKGTPPTIEEILDFYRGLPGYEKMENALIDHICRTYSLTDQLPVRVKLTDRHIRRFRRALASMSAAACSA